VLFLALWPVLKLFKAVQQAFGSKSVATSDVLHGMQDRKLQLYSFEGVKAREWVMDSIIR